MRARARCLIGGMAAMLLIAGCVSHMSRGPNLYDEGRYVEAAQAFERTERYLPDASPSDRARYGLYRGMNFLALGDCGHAQRWLSFATEIERRSPGSLGDERRALLDQAWQKLLRDRERQPPSVPSSVVATSQLAPPGSDRGPAATDTSATEPDTRSQ